MKKILLIIASALLLLTGCSDAHAKVNNPTEEIIKIGNKSITKEEVYNNLLTNYGSYFTITDATDKILDAEIEITDEMREEANSAIETYKAFYPEQWEEFLSYYGYSNEDEFINSIIRGERLTKLTENYVYDQWDDLMDSYNPKKAIVLSFTDSDMANAALVELKKGTDPQEVATAYASSLSGSSEIITSESTYTTDVMAIVNTASINDNYAMIPSTDGVTTYIVKVEETDPNNIQEEVASSLASYDSIQIAADEYYFRKYDFTIYDKTLYDDIKANYSNYVVQK